MERNEEILQKAVITTSQLAPGGKLQPEQSDQFIDYVFDETLLIGHARTHKFSAEDKYIDKIGVGRRVAVPKAEATDPGVRNGITTGRVTLHPEEIMVPFEASYNTLEVNIEKEKLADRLVKMFATATANNVEELYINGDSLGPAIHPSELPQGGSATKYVKDTYLALFDGWLKLARQGHTVDMAGANISIRAFSKMLNALPDKFKKKVSDLRFFCNSQIEQNFREKVASRATGKGDDALTSSMPLTPFGVPLIPVPFLPFRPQIVEHVTLNGTTAVSLLYKPVTDVVVTTSTLGTTEEDAYVEGTDYTLDANNGTIARIGAGSIPDGATVKVTYKALPQVILTHKDNFLIGIGRDIRIESDKDIFKGTLQWAITAKVSCEIEETDAVALGYNIGTDV